MDFARRNQISADRVLQEIAAIAFSDITNIVECCTDRFSVKDSTKLSLEARVAIQSITIRQTERGLQASIKLYDKIRALELLGERLGLFSIGASASGYESALQEAIAALDREELERQLTVDRDTSARA